MTPYRYTVEKWFLSCGSGRRSCKGKAIIGVPEWFSTEFYKLVPNGIKKERLVVRLMERAYEDSRILRIENFNIISTNDNHTCKPLHTHHTIQKQFRNTAIVLIPGNL